MPLFDLLGINLFAHMDTKASACAVSGIKYGLMSPKRSDRSLGEGQPAISALPARPAICTSQIRSGNVLHSRACVADEQAGKPSSMLPQGTEQYNLGRSMACPTSCATEPGS